MIGPLRPEKTIDLFGGRQPEAPADAVAEAQVVFKEKIIEAIDNTSLIDASMHAQKTIDEHMSYLESIGYCKQQTELEVIRQRYQQTCDNTFSVFGTRRLLANAEDGKHPSLADFGVLEQLQPDATTLRQTTQRLAEYQVAADTAQAGPQPIAKDILRHYAAEHFKNEKAEILGELIAKKIVQGDDSAALRLIHVTEQSLNTTVQLSPGRTAGEVINDTIPDKQQVKMFGAVLAIFGSVLGTVKPASADSPLINIVEVSAPAPVGPIEQPLTAASPQTSPSPAQPDAATPRTVPPQPDTQLSTATPQNETPTTGTPSPGTTSDPTTSPDIPAPTTPDIAVNLTLSGSTDEVTGISTSATSTDAQLNPSFAKKIDNQEAAVHDLAHHPKQLEKATTHGNMFDKSSQEIAVYLMAHLEKDGYRKVDNPIFYQTILAKIDQLETQYEARKGALTPDEARSFRIDTALLQAYAYYPDAMKNKVNTSSVLVKGFSDGVDMRYLHVRTADLMSQFPDIPGSNQYNQEQLSSYAALIAIVEDRFQTSKHRENYLKQQLGDKYSPPVTHHQEHLTEHQMQLKALDTMQRLGPEWHNRAVAMRFFIEHGFTPIQAAGLIGNFCTEAAGCELNPAVNQIGGGPGRGIAQWGNSTEYGYDRFGYDIGNLQGVDHAGTLVWFAAQHNSRWDVLQTQLDFVAWELQHTQKAAGAALLRSKTLHEATDVVLNMYERPAVPYLAPRLAHAQGTYAKYEQLVKHIRQQNHHRTTHHEHLQSNTVPDGFAARARYYAHRLEIPRSAISYWTSYAGIEHFTIDPRVAAQKLGIVNTYPKQYRDHPLDALVDNYGMYSRECVSYVAYKVSTDKFPSTMPHWGGVDNRPDLPGVQGGNANDWALDARGDHITVNKTPAVGSVMQWGTNGLEHAFAGHVAYVEKVNGDGSIVVSQYNLGGTGDYSVEIISPQLMKLQEHQIHFLHFEK